jgi:hypothetical protein
MMDAPKSRAFSASELVQCEVCSRPNAPTRATCLYCGTALKITELNAFSAEPVKNSDGISDVIFHLVVVNPRRLDQAALNEIAELVATKPSDLQSLLTHSVGAPVFVGTSEQQAHIAAAKLEARGVSTKVISDEQLAVEDAPKPISALKIHDDKILGSIGRSAQVVDELWANVTLIVSGRLYFATREIDQKQNRSQVIDEREMLTDEAVLDVYFADDAPGWRIRAASFDFSCLGERKQLTAFANFTALTGLFHEHASEAAFDDSYTNLRVALNSVWPIEPTASAKERRRTGLRAFDSSITSIDNELQFTRYSRLLRHLYASKSKDHAAQT